MKGTFSVMHHTKRASSIVAVIAAGLLALGLLHAQPATHPIAATIPTSLGLTYADIRAGGNTNSAVTFFSIGTGICAVISCPNGNKILSDCGSKSVTPELEKRALGFFKEIVQRNDKLYIILSHPDTDHYDKIMSFVGDYPIVGNHSVERVIAGGEYKKYSVDLTRWIGKLITQKGENTPVTKDLKPRDRNRFLSPNTGVTCRADNVTTSADGIYILTVNAGTSKNDSSLIFRFAHGIVSATFTGDAGAKSTADVIEANQGPAWTRSTLLAAAHHGAESEGANNEGWATATAPRAVVFSAGTAYENYAHPKCTSEAVYLKAPGARIQQGVVAHSFTCYQAQYKPEPNNLYTNAMYNLADTGALVFLSDGTNWGIWTCPGNDITKCIRSY